MSNTLIKLQPLADRAAIGLSLLCALHCTALPLLLVLSPSVLAMGFQDEAFHLWIVLVVIPVSVFALTMGCREHKHMGVLFLGVAGLLVLALSGMFGHDLLGAMGEKAATLFGAGLIAVSHVKNFMLCQQAKVCECPD